VNELLLRLYCSRADMCGVCGCAGIKLTTSNGTTDPKFAYFINVFQQNIVFEDSVLEGLAPPADFGILSMVNSTVSFVRLTVKSCTLSGTQSVVFNLGTFNNIKPESLIIQDSHFIHNRGNKVLGEGYLVWQNSGKLLMNNTHFIGNTASAGGQVLSVQSGIDYPATYGLTLHASTFRNNSGGINGCVYVYGATGVEMSDCTFDNNRADGGRLGGALQVPAPQVICAFLLKLAALLHRNWPVGWRQGGLHSLPSSACIELPHELRASCFRTDPPARCHPESMGNGGGECTAAQPPSLGPYGGHNVAHMHAHGHSGHPQQHGCLPKHALRSHHSGTEWQTSTSSLDAAPRPPCLSATLAASATASYALDLRVQTSVACATWLPSTCKQPHVPVHPLSNVLQQWQAFWPRIQPIAPLMLPSPPSPGNATAR
jgi:hypothetical protein